MNVIMMVATVLTVYGIETAAVWRRVQDTRSVATVLTVYGIETLIVVMVMSNAKVATVLTVYGIETSRLNTASFKTFRALQQYLPFTVLKHDSITSYIRMPLLLQQYLPFTVLKLPDISFH